MLDFFENAVFVLSAIVIIFLAVGICIAGTPSLYHPAQLSPPTKITDPGRIKKIEDAIRSGNSDSRNRRNSNAIKTYITLDRRYKEKYSHFQDAYQLLLQAESRFVKDRNGLDVIEITYITPGSILEQLGFRKGDHIYSINGYSLGSEEEALKLFYDLKKCNVFYVELIRDGRPIIMNFKFE
ncbi:MAG: hypothetical protein E3J72_22795 [Planctomycetota bacterium]|nr:MAG: hypothetical protein E3J72_22795 [Planctomycetota bacterium]